MPRSGWSSPPAGEAHGEPAGFQQALSQLEQARGEANPRLVAALCETALQRFGTRWQLHLCASQVYEEMRHWSDAIRHWQALVRWAPMEPRYHYRLGRACRLAERYQEALHECWWAWRLSSQEGDAGTMNSSAEEMRQIDALMMARLQRYLQEEPALVDRLLRSPHAVLVELGIIFSPSAWAMLEWRLLEMLAPLLSSRREERRGDNEPVH